MKKDFIEKIRKCNKDFRIAYNMKCGGVFINGVYFFYNSVKLRFFEFRKELFIYERKNDKIVAIIPYQTLEIGLDDWNYKH